MKIFVNREPVSGPWGGGNNFVKAFYEVASTHGHEVTPVLKPDTDIIFVIDPRPENKSPGIQQILTAKQSLPKSKIVQRINECDARKNTEHMDHFLLQCSQYNDMTIFVSKWMQEYFIKKGWACGTVSHLHNGVDTEMYDYAHSQRQESDGLLRVVAHHWSNNLLKGFDAYEFLDYLAGKGEIHFKYIGRHRDSFRHAQIVEPCVGHRLATNLANNDVYISASRFDPGPNHILEALAARLPTYVHTDGGGAVEFAGDSHTFSNLEDIETIIKMKNHAKNDYNPIGWEQCILNYLHLMERL